MIPQGLQDSIDQLFADPQPHTLYTAAELFSEPQRLCCATCAFWKPARPTDVRGVCELDVVYGAPAFDYDQCLYHSQRDTVPMQSGARG